MGARRIVGTLLVLLLGSCGTAAAAPPTITEFSSGITAGSGAQGIALGPDGNMWFTEFGASRIGRITPTGTVTEFLLPAGAMPYDITAGHDGVLYFTQFGDDKIGRITTAGTLLTAVPLAAGADPIGIATDRRGRIWATETGPDALAIFTPGGSLVESSAGITPGSDPRGITSGADNAMWFTSGSTSKLGRRGLFDSAATEISATGGDAITSAPDGSLWYARPSGNGFSAYFPGGEGLVFAGPPTSGSMPLDVAPGPDGRMWVTEGSAGQIAAIRQDFSGEEFGTGITPASTPFAIAAGADGAMWFTEFTGRVGRITTGEDPFALNAPAALSLGATAGGASTYPSSIDVAGLTGVVTRVRVRLNGLFAQEPEDLAALLVDPGGRSVMLFNGAGSAADADGAVLTFADDGHTLDGFASGRYVPRGEQILGGPLPAPAPAGPYRSGLATFNGTDPNGRWKLFLARTGSSTTTGDVLVGGWSLDVQTAPPQTVQVPVPGPSVTAAGPPDGQRASVRVSGAPSKTTLAKLRKGFTLTVTPNEPVALDVSLSGSQKQATLSAVRVALVEKSFGLSGARRTVRIKPSSTAIGSPRKAFKLRLRVLATDRGGNRTTIDRTIRVSVVKRKKR